MSKLIYLIRHGVAQHNDNFLKYGNKHFIILILKILD